MDRNNVILEVSPQNSIIIKRKLFWKTKRDLTIEGLPIKNESLVVKLIIRAIRFYQKNISHTLWNRCVFDPSCSHYSELAFRKKWIIRWFILTLKRLHRCKPQNGWIDELS